MAETTADPEVRAAPVQATAELSDFAEYLLRIVPALMEDKDSAPPQLKTTIFEKSTSENIKKFLGDPQIPVLLIQRSSTKGKYVFYYFLDFPYFFFNDSYFGRRLIIIINIRPHHLR